MKYGHDDIRDVLERASARETAARVAIGSIARQLLCQLGADIVSHVVSIGSVSVRDPLALTYSEVRGIQPDSPLHCADAEAESRMIAEIDRAREAGDTMGGSFEVIAHDVPPGLGSYVQWDRKLDGRLGQALMSIPAIKAVGIGRGPAVASLPGSRIHDEILPPGDTSPNAAARVARPTNNAGGLEGGVTNGEDLRITGYFPSGTSSVLFIGMTGVGNYCYGEAAACNDPSNGSKGEHAYPYRAYVWAYDANDLLAVKNGSKQPWTVTPYQTWELTEPTDIGVDFGIGGAAYDPKTNRIYISRKPADGSPTIYVYEVTNGTAAVRPNSPTAVSAQ